MKQALRSQIASSIRFLALREFHGAQGGIIHGVFRHADHIRGLKASGQFDVPLFPKVSNVVNPGFAHSANESVGSPEQ